MDTHSSFIWRFLIAIFTILSFCASAVSKVTTVTSPSDNGSGSLRSAISLSSANDTIKFNIPGTDKIFLEDEVAIFKDIVILGSNIATGNRIIIQVSEPGVSAYRVFSIGGYSGPQESVVSTPSVILLDAVLRGGQPASGDGGVISVTGNLIADNVVISDGVAVRGGGIAFSKGTLKLNNCTITNNSCQASGENTFTEVTAQGGGIYTYDARVLIINSTIVNNRCQATGTCDSSNTNITTYAEGGGIYYYSGYLTIVNSSIVNNTINAHSTASYPRAFAHGGGLCTYEGQLSLAHCTILNNACISRGSSQKVASNVNADGGGIYSVVTGTSIVNSITSNNSITIDTVIGIEDIYNFTPGQALNSIVDTCTHVSLVNCLTRQTNQKVFGSASPQLTNNGGPTQTILLPANSVAIGAGIKTALFYRDTMTNIKDSVPEISYLSGTTWLALKTNAPVPAGKKLLLIDFDQRGKTRAAVPCIGAFEYTSTINTVPDIPITCSPLSAASDQPLTTRLVWHAAQRASTYNVQVSLKADFSTLVKDTSGITDTSLVLSGLAPGTCYYWCVSAANNIGVSHWSITLYFTSTQSNQSVPSQIILTLPSNGAKIEADSVFLVWKTGMPTADRYSVEIATDSAMSHLFFIDSTVTDTTKHIAWLSGGITYWWHVRAHNAVGWGPFSQKNCFTYTSNVGVRKYATAIFAISFNGNCGELSYTIARRCFVRLTIIDLQGKTVGSFINQVQNPGRYTFNSHFSHLPKGSYIQIFSAGDFTKKSMIMFLK